MQVRSKRFWAILLTVVMLLGMIPLNALAADAPFTVTVGGNAITQIEQSTLSWANWDGSTSDVTCYTVTVPQGSTEATLTFPESMQWMYYNAQGVYLGQDSTSTTSAATHTVKIQDAYKVGDDGYCAAGADGELDGISVQVPDSWSTSYYIQFVYESAEGGSTSCLTTQTGAPTTATVSAGGMYQLPLNQVFADSSHSPTYSFTTSVENDHTKISNGIFYFSTSETGTYEVTLTAKCDAAEVSHKLTVTVEKANEGIAAQYGYDETAKSTVTVYVTLSNDGYPITAADGTVMSHLKVTVPYFDLSLYGLEDFYRYGTDGGSGPYTNETIVQRPTGLHLYIYLLERYYMGLDESKCCLGTSGVLSYMEDVEVKYMNGEAAYTSGGKSALQTSGGATSLYMVNFWGHDENLMYFRNHCYPYMSAGWGATSDYILLSDGDTWDVGMFTNWSFYHSGYFARFAQDEYTAEPGASLTVATQKWGTTSTASAFEAVNGLEVALYDSEWKEVQKLTYDSETGNSLTFTAPTTAGTYYLMATDPDKCSSDADIAPATARIVVGSAGTGETATVSRILLNTYEATLTCNDEAAKTQQLTATVLPAEATGWTLTWTSSNEAVATVDSNGLVTGVAEGTAVITAAIGDIKAECTITVEKYNSAPIVVSDAPTRTKVKTGETVELAVSSLFTDAEGDTLTCTAEVCEATGLGSGWEYTYTAVEGFDTTVTDGKFSVSFPETGIYAIRAIASDGKLTTSHEYQVTVVDNDSGVIKLNDGVTLDFYGVVVVDSSEEYAEDFEIPYKGTHDTTIHHIVLSKDTVSGTPNRKMDVIVAEGYGWEQYANGAPTQETEFSTRNHIGLFVYDTAKTRTAHYLQFHTECQTHTDEDKDIVCDVCTMDLSCETCTDSNSDKTCDVCGKNLNKLPTLIEGVEDLTVKIQTGFSYQLEDLMNGKIFTDEDDKLTYENYYYYKSSDGGQTWGERQGFAEMEHGTVNSQLSNSTEGTYLYRFVANDGTGDSEEVWTLTLQVMDVVPADVNFYVSQDQNYKTNGNIYPVLELYKTAGIDENQYDYVGWFTNAAGKTEYVYNPADYEIIDGETDYVVIDEVKYELHDYEKIVFTNSAFDATDTTATASGTVVSNYNTFYATIVTGRYSTRAYGWNTETQAYDIYLGGQSMELPMEKDIYGGGGGDIYLRVVSVRTTSKKIDNTYFTADDYYVEMIMPVTGSMIHSGDPYVSGNYTYYPFMSYAAGNASLYNYYLYPYDTENYIFGQSINNTTSKGTGVQIKNGTISTVLKLSVTVPKDAEFKLYFQYNNFNTKEVDWYSISDSMTDPNVWIYTYKVSKSNGNYTWRLSDPTGKYVTKAGWLANITADTAVAYSFEEGDATDKTTHNFNRLGTVVATRDEADIQVFVSSTGSKSISGTERIRAYRMWEIINSDTANIMIEPDFNLQVLQGNASDFKLVDGGNAGGNWIDVTPTTTNIIAVNYDAIDVYSTAGNYGSHGGLYPATNPERTSVAVITNEKAGTADANVSFNGSKDTDRGSEWDYNYDTWYYLNTDTAPTLDFTVTATGDVSVSYATVITGSDLKSTLSGWTTLTADDEGSYSASMLAFREANTLGGTVIIKMTDSTGTSYRLIRVAEMTVNVSNATNPGEPFQPGDDVSITFEGLYRSVNKISGVFNPTTYYLRYTAGETEVNGKLAQYQQLDNTSITLTIPEDITFPEGETTVDYSFTNGYLYGSMYSASSPFNTMYYMTDTGMGTNFSAVGTSFVLSRFADIPVTVQRTQYYDMKLVISDGENILTNCTVTLTNPDGTALTPDENGVYQDLGYGSYPCAIVASGFRNYNTALVIGAADAENVVDGIMTKTVVLEKGAEGVWDGTTATEPAAVDGIYQISTGAELAWLAQTVNAGTTDISAVLTRDIDLGYFAWTPIGTSSTAFAGTLDGQNHKIYNLYISSTTGATYLGLFGNASGTIKNLTVDGSISNTSTSSVSFAYMGGVAAKFSGTMTNVHSNVDVTVTRVKGNWSCVGGLIGYGMSPELTNCSNTGNVSGYNYVGGLIGNSLGTPSVTGCFNSGNISGNQYVSGIACVDQNGKFTACYNTGNVTGSSTYVGGITNAMNALGYVKNCFNTGTISGKNNSGAIVGRLSASKAVITDCYYYEDSYSTGISNGSEAHEATAVSAETLASAAFVESINAGLETAAFKAGIEHPVLTWQIIKLDSGYGDTDGNGEVEMIDVPVILKHLNGESMTTMQTVIADVNADGEITMKDISLILQYINGKIEKFPAEG